MPRSKSSISPRPSGSAAAAEPVGPAELDDIFAGYAGLSRIALAVSGGPDSLALMHLSVAWRAQVSAGRPELIVLTVDHGLRPEASTEADAVAQAARALGLEARILTRPAPPTRSALQAQARADRYRLMAAAALEEGAGALVTGHTLEDQAETLLMRLARGSGLDGLSAMPPAGRLGSLKLLRPLLGLSKARLEASLTVRGVGWAVDPSNADPVFERPRLRALMPALSKVGLTAEAIGASARRLARVRVALEQTTAQAASRLVAVHDEGYFGIERNGFEALPEEIALRLIGRLIARLGTPGQPERLARLERLVSQLKGASAPAANLGGCMVKALPDRILILREPGRRGLPVLTLRPGETAEWDRRCRLKLRTSAQAEATIRAPIEADFHGELAAAARASGLPREVLLAAPSAWQGGKLLALPALGFVTSGLTFEPCLTLSAMPDALDNDIATTCPPQI